MNTTQTANPVTDHTQVGEIASIEIDGVEYVGTVIKKQAMAGLTLVSLSVSDGAGDGENGLYSVVLDDVA